LALAEAIVGLSSSPLRTTFALPDLRRQAPGGLHYVIQTSGVFPSRP
jgi:microcystin-dependent protein